MNPMEACDVQNGIMENSNSLWRLWLGVTFAAIAAFHVGRDSILKSLLALAIFLFGTIATLVFAYGQRKRPVSAGSVSTQG